MHGWLPVPLPAIEKNALGYLAGALVLCTFSVRSMRLLRCIGIASNVAFISYALVVWLPPIAILHGLLLPVNVFRLFQLERERIARSRLSAPGAARHPRPIRGGALYGSLGGDLRAPGEPAGLRQLD